MADVKTENVGGGGDVEGKPAGGGDVKEKHAGGGDVKEKHAGGGDVEKPAVTEVKKETNGFKEEVSDLERKIIEQIEYYFGNCNLPKDKFLQQQIKLDDGWVPLETMMKFNRLAKLSTDIKVISSAIKKSKSGLMEVHEDETKIRRCPTEVLPEMNEARRQELVTRSLYVKGFPTEDIELDTLLQFFGKYTKLEQLIMRKHHDKAEKQWIFKGSVFAVFPSLEEAEKFLNLKDIKYEDQELIIKWQKDYIEDKRNIRLQSKLENQNKKRKIKDDVKEEEDGEDEEEEKNKSLPTGASLHISDCPDDISREDIKTKIEELGVSVAFVYFNKGETEGRVRLQEAGSAAEVVKNLKDGKLEINGKEVTVGAIEGEEEIQFLEKAKEDKAKRRIQNSKNQRGRKGKGGGGGNWRKRKGNHFREENETSGKKSRQ